MTILDVALGDDFVVVVIKKAGQQHKKLVNKNNYVIVHKPGTSAANAEDEEFGESVNTESTVVQARGELLLPLITSQLILLAVTIRSLLVS